jgi:hypothetical protein
MNEKTQRNAARLILFGMFCSIIGTIGGAAFSSEAKTVVPETTVVEVIVKQEPMYSLNVSAGVHKVLWENVHAKDEPDYMQNDSPLVQSGNVFTEETTEVTEEDTEVVEPENLAKDGKPYRYYKIVDKGYETTLDYELQEYTYDLCVEYNCTEYFTLILSQLYKESTYRYDVISKTNDWGIAQINACNHEWLSEVLGITDFLDPRQSILCNIYLMSGNLEKYSVESSLICYNAGKPNSTNPHAKQYARDIIGLWNNCIVEIQKE